MLILTINISQKIDEIELRRKGFPPIVVKNLGEGTYAVNESGESSSIEVPVAITITDKNLPRVSNAPSEEIVNRIKEHARTLAQGCKKAKGKIIPYKIARESVQRVCGKLKESEYRRMVDLIRKFIERVFVKERVQKMPYYLDNR